MVGASVTVECETVGEKNSKKRKRKRACKNWIGKLGDGIMEQPKI